MHPQLMSRNSWAAEPFTMLHHRSGPDAKIEHEIQFHPHCAVCSLRTETGSTISKSTQVCACMIDHDQSLAFSRFHDVGEGLTVWDALNAMCQHLPAHLYLPAKLHPGDVSLRPYISSTL